MRKKYKYRFKTEEEFIKEFGNRWRNNNPLYWNDRMDYLLGTNFDIDFNGNEEVKIRRLDDSNEYWTISIHHITKEELILTPDYKPKKFVY